MSLCRLDSTGFADNPLHGRVVAIEKLGDMLERLTLPPALPHQRFLLLAVVNPAPLFHLQHSRRSRSF
jgi:hypothetical protein